MATGMNNRITLFILLLGCFGAVPAQEDSQTIPPPPSISDQEAEIEPEVTIIRRKDKTIEEYRVNGRLYMIKVTPKNAPPYFLIDSNGDGSMDLQRSELEPRLMVPNWMIYRW
jgi:hypothetical protein